MTVNINEKDRDTVKNFLTKYLNGTIDEKTGQLLIKNFTDEDIEKIAKDITEMVVTANTTNYGWIVATLYLT